MIIITREEIQTNRINLMDKAYELLNLFYNKGYEAYPVGGCVRDFLRMGNPWSIHDIDITTNASPTEIINLANENKLNWFQEGHNGLVYGTVTVIYDNVPMQITPFRTDVNFKGRHCDTIPAKTLREDLERRDFTINAIALDRNGNAIDYFGGIADIEKRTVKSIEKPNITYKRDKLRTMRAVRISTETGFGIEEETYNEIKNVDLNEVDSTNEKCPYTILSKERIRDELIRILKLPNRFAGIFKLDDTGLLYQIIPELLSLKGTTQDVRFHPEKDVFVHTMLALKSLPPNASLELVLATLLHDIGKPLTRVIEGDEIHFYEHEIVGSGLTFKILCGLKFPSEATKKVEWLVRNHMRVHRFDEMKKSKKVQLITNVYFNDLLELLKADIHGSSGVNNKIEHMEGVAQIVQFMYDYKIELEERPALKQKLINGYDVMNLGVTEKEGILIGSILETVSEAVINGHINNREEAIECAKDLVENYRNSVDRVVNKWT